MVKITIPSEQVLRRANTTRILNRLSRLTLAVGDNFETVNHSQFSNQMRMFPTAGVIVNEIKSDSTCQ